MFYRQVLEIYAIIIDHDASAEASIQFFKKVQNTIHYAISGETAAEVIYHRADAEKEFIGLKTFSGEQPTLREATVAQNYLDEKELRAMGQFVSGYLDFAERQAEREIAMTMADWAKHKDFREFYFAVNEQVDTLLEIDIIDMRERGLQGYGRNV